MGFRFRCPKCNTTSFSIERDARSYAPRGQSHELIFSCRCGKQLFGDAIEQEYLRQKAEWEATAGDRRRHRGDKSKEADAEIDAAYERQRAARLKREQEEAAALEAKRQEEDRLWRERVAKATADDDGDEHEEEDEDEEDAHDHHHVEVKGKKASPAVGTCEWKGCKNPARPGSKYCSRDCSNKNARSRYKRRRGNGQEAA